MSADSDLRRFADDSSDAASANLFDGLRAAEGVYTFVALSFEKRATALSSVQ